MIRHGIFDRRFGGWAVSTAIASLTIAVVKPAFRTLLVTTVCFAPLFPPALFPATVPAVSVSPVTVRTDEKQRPAFLGPTKPLQKDEITIISHRSAGGVRQPDSNCGKIAAWIALLRFCGAAKTRTPVARYNRGSLLPPNARYYQISYITL